MKNRVICVDYEGVVVGSRGQPMPEAIQSLFLLASLPGVEIVVCTVDPNVEAVKAEMKGMLQDAGCEFLYIVERIESAFVYIGTNTLRFQSWRNTLEDVRVEMSIAEVEEINKWDEYN